MTGGVDLILERAKREREIAIDGHQPLGDANARRISVPGLAKPDVYARTMGWRALGEEADRLARQTGARTVVGEYRDVVASLAYYLRNTGRAVLTWPSGGAPTHHYDLTRQLSRSAPGPVLLLSHCGSPTWLSQYYRNVEPLGRVDARTGPTSVRSFFAFKLSEPIAEIGPASGC